MNNSLIISNVKDIDLSRHGIIEAHAGTGKTYTIVKMVLRMLEQSSEVRGKYIHLKDILLVTYTEKAAGELKKRIQDGIKELRVNTKDANLAAHLDNCLNNMHEALIGTIHSVCLRLLQTWPFETGVHFSTQMIDDKEGIETLLRESMRTDWQNAENLSQMIKEMEQQGIKIGNKHLQLIRQTALELLNNDRSIDTTLQSQPIYALIHHAAEVLAERYRAYKRQNGFVSFYDMLRLMHNTVHSDNCAMLETLRRRLRYGIIDEFQDTSVTQWEIFKKIFLDAGTSAKMFIVGDPKQSIYSFQNADILSYIAAKDIIVGLGGVTYSLIDNYRSLPEMINGYNAIFSRKNTAECDNGDDWFLFGGDGDMISYPSKGDGGECARPPKREPPTYPLKHKAVQVVEATGKNDGELRQAMVRAACAAINKLKGTPLSIPDGLNWKNITLDYCDFAVIVDTHTNADPFIEEFRKRGIPCTKYKLAGVFNSAMARDLLAVLTAIYKRDTSAPRTAALLTHFFNKPADTIDPIEDLKPCPNHYCKGDDLCAAHAFDYWEKLADRQLWPQLFNNIIERTAIRQKLIRLVDGERKLADLRQVADYCIEYLYQQNSSFKQLIDHLERLYNNEEDAGQDKNIHTLSTEKSSVKILTMHAAKGLEFPIVFIMSRTGAKRMANGPSILHWTDDNGKRRFTPYLTIAKGTDERESLTNQIDSYNRDQRREFRRLLYVAITRPQAMLFIPLREKEKEISPHLEVLLGRKDADVEMFGGECGIKTKSDEMPLGVDVNSAFRIGLRLDKHGPNSALKLNDIPKLSVQKFITQETSYTQLSLMMGVNRQDDVDSDIDIDTGGHDVDPDDEYHVEDVEREDINTEDINTKATPLSPTPLIGGRLTGDALHRAIEELLCADDINAIINNNDMLNSIIEKYLRRAGIWEHPLTKDPEAAVKQASSYIKTALTTPYPAANGGSIIIANIPKADRIPEVEFLFSCNQPNEETLPIPTGDSHRIRGFIDFVFRVPNEGYPPHPYRYYIIDWKSDTLESYDREALKRCCDERNYTMQAQIYTHALDKYLRGILGGRYSREENLGGAMCVFIRGSGAYHRELCR
jgi:exodeoxyribonuclease V beta subunit